MKNNFLDKYISINGLTPHEKFVLELIKKNISKWFNTVDLANPADWKAIGVDSDLARRMWKVAYRDVREFARISAHKNKVHSRRAEYKEIIIIPTTFIQKINSFNYSCLILGFRWGRGRIYMNID